MPKRLNKKTAKKTKAKLPMVTVYPRTPKKVTAALAKQLNEAYEHGRQDAFKDVRDNPPTARPDDSSLLHVDLAFRGDNRELRITIKHQTGAVSADAYAKAVESVVGIIQQHGLPPAEHGHDHKIPTLPVLSGAH